jgi:hypothetical protein
MYIQFIFVLIAICILTLSITKYKEGQCVMPGTPEAAKVKTRSNDINKRISDQTATLTNISSRVNQILLNYSDFKFSINNVQVDPNAKTASITIDQSDTATVSNPTMNFTLITSPKGEKGDSGNQGLPGDPGDGGSSGTNGLPGYWGQRGGCST